MTARHTPSGPGHTPGPWKYHVGRGANPRWHVQTTGGYQIASTPEISRHVPEAAEQEATARLIAAAPDLLEQLERLLLVAGQANPKAAPSSSIGFEMMKARAAIARAREAV